MQAEQPSGVWVFDLDGTLSNPLEGMLASVNHALVTHGFSEVSAHQMREHIGPPLETTLAEFASVDQADPHSESIISDLIQGYRSHYKKSGYAMNTLYPGITDVLKTLAASNIRMGVCTAKTAPVATMILEHFGIKSYFEFVSGGDIGVAKSSQLSTLLADGCIDQNALMIGDRQFDLVAANTNNLKSCAVAWGYGSLQELEAEKPHAIVHEPRQLLELLFDPAVIACTVASAERSEVGAGNSG